MPRQTDHSDRPDTLPREELNPTLNPILGQNMGRWAEVYYKSPPDKREEAVLDLLHKLKAENGLSQETEAVAPRRAEAAIPQMDLIHCPSCGAENTADQRFCGMCGAHVDARPPEMPRTMTSGTTTSRTVQEPIHEEAADVSPTSVSPTPSAQNWQSSFLPREDAPDSYSNNHFLSGSYEDDEPPSRPYRAYVGAALAIIIVALGYMAWRSEQAASGSRLSPQAPPAVATEPAPPPAPIAQTQAPETQAKVAPGNDSSNSSAPPPEPTEKNTSAKLGTERATPAAMIAGDQPRNEEPIQQRPQESATGGSGSEELAIARRYLSGTGGQPRNAAEAVDWLWKAVAKRNLDATLQLSDLFLRGNGVPKNCDQARVLLQAAASKGNSGAAERLRHMQAFGCD